MANDSIVIPYEARTKELEASLNKVEKELLDVEKAATKSMKKVGDESKKTGVEVEKTGKKVSNLSDTFKDLANQLPFANQVKQVSELTSTVTGLGNAAKSSAVGFQILKFAIAATGIGLLITAVIALIQYFKRTDEGATNLAGIMAGLSAALDVVTGFFVSTGEAIYNTFTGIENLKVGLSNFGDFLVGQVTNRLLGFIEIFKALYGVIKAQSEFLNGDFDKASETFSNSLDNLKDASLRFVTGIEDAGPKLDAFALKIAEAAQAAFEWEQRMDALSDKIRQDSVTIAKNESAITKLIIASKNKQLQDDVALGKLEQASQLERENLRITLENENKKIELLKERNKRESDSINQDQLNSKQRRSINDKYNQELIDQINKVEKINQESANLQEKIENRKDAKREEIFQNNLKRISQEEILQENIAKERFIQNTISAEELEKELYDIKLNGLIAQKELLVTEGRDIVEVDKAILDLELQNRFKSDKAKADAAKLAADAKKKQDKEDNDAFLKALEERLKEEDRLVTEHEAKLKQIREAGVQILGDLASGLYDSYAQKRENDLKEEEKALTQKSEMATAVLQKQLDNGIISQEQFDARKLALDKRTADAQAALKKKQFMAEKRAKLTAVAIDTAASVAKTLANLGIPAGLVAAAIAVATGAAQAAIIASQPIPKFKDGVIGLQGKGTGTSDSNVAMLSKGESVMTAKETGQYRNVLESIRDNKFDDFITDTYVLPALLKQEALRNREREERKRSKQEAKMDTAKLEAYTRANKNVGITNTKQLAKDMRRENALNSNWYK